MKKKSKFPITGNIINQFTLEEEFDFFAYNLSYYLNRSILEGKYIKDVTRKDTIEISDKLQGITMRLLMQSSLSTVPPSFNQESIVDYNYIFDYQINTYNLFTEKTKRLYSKENIEFINKSIFLDNNNLYYNKFKSFIELLNYNIELAKIDHSFLNEDSILKQLFNIKNSLISIRITIPISGLYTNYSNSLGTHFEVLIKALRMKCEFLIDKWYARSKTKLFDENLKHKNLFENNQHINYIENKTLSDFKDKIIYLYEINGYEYKTILKNCFQKINRKDLTRTETINDLNLFELHTLIKYYKDEVKDLHLLKNLIPVFEKKISNDQNNLYENFTFHVAKQYCQNNYFSLYCEKLKNKVKNISTDQLLIELEKLSEEYNTINDQTVGPTDNFFLHYKYLENSLEILDSHLDSCKENILEAVIKTKSYHKHLEADITAFEKKFQWSLKNNNYIFKLPYNESTVRYAQLKVYFSSSFLLPKINEEIVSGKKNVEEINQKLKLIYNTEIQLNSINILIKETNKLKESYDEDNKRIIEIVSIFSAVISFIVGSIGGFKFVTDIYSAVTFTICLGLCLMIFLFFIMRFLGKKEYATFWDFGFLFILLAFVALVSLNMQKTLQPEKNTTNTESDNIIKLKIDV